MKLKFRITTEDSPSNKLDLAIDLPEKYARMGLESLRLVSAVKKGLDKIKEALDEEGDDRELP